MNFNERQKKLCFFLGQMLLCDCRDEDSSWCMMVVAVSCSVCHLCFCGLTRGMLLFNFQSAHARCAVFVGCCHQAFSFSGTWKMKSHFGHMVSGHLLPFLFPVLFLAFSFNRCSSKPTSFSTEKRFAIFQDYFRI